MAIATNPLLFQISIWVRDRLDVNLIMWLLEGLSMKLTIIHHLITGLNQYPLLSTCLFPFVIVIVIDKEYLWYYYCSITITITITRIVAIYFCWDLWCCYYYRCGSWKRYIFRPHHYYYCCHYWYSIYYCYFYLSAFC